jgi:signal transduction histidine kinase
MDQLEQQQWKVLTESCDIAAMLSLKKASSLTPDRLSISLSTLPTVNSDMQLLRIIFNNLINNALKYSALNTKIEIDAMPSEQQGKLGVLIRIQINQAHLVCQTRNRCLTSTIVAQVHTA